MVTMPIQVYHCRDHKDFEVLLRVGGRVPAFKLCPVIIEGQCVCRNRSPWVPPTVSFPGGPTTGARPPYIRGDDDA